MNRLRGVGLPTRAIAGDVLDPRRLDDFHYVFSELVAGYMHAVEQVVSTPRRVRLAERIFFMQHGVDPVDDANSFVNYFEHLSGGRTRPDRGHTSWHGPASTASLSRVLVDHVTWEAPPAEDSQRTLDRLAATEVDALPGVSVDDVVRWALLHNTKDTFGRSLLWGIDGVAMTVRPKREVSLDAVSPLAFAVDDDPTDQTSGGSSLSRFRGLYNRARVEADGIVFGGSAGRPNAQVVPRLPGLLLATAYTIEFLTTGEWSDVLVLEEDRVLEELVDRGRVHAWNRVAMPALHLIDPEVPQDAANKLCERAAERFPWLIAMISADFSDAPEGR